MTALGKLFRTTTFKLTLVYLTVFAMFAAFLLGYFALNTRRLIDEQITDTVNAEITGLSEQYSQGGIRRLVLAGIQTDYCVDTTCRRAFSLGYDVTLVADGHTTWDGDAFSEKADDALRAAQIIAHHNRVLGDGFVTLRKAEEISFP